jgi:alkaline phosphatase D
MLDTRHYDRSITDLYWNTDYVHDISNDAGRSLMGSRQENWFYNQLRTSNTTWRVIGSQVVFSRLNESLALGNTNPLNYDSWDGYLGNKNRTLKTLYDNNIGNNIFLAGDSHASWVSDIAWLDEKAYNGTSGQGAIGVEFAGSAVTSPCPYGANISLELANTASTALVAANSELQWSDIYYRGYFELKISHEKVDAQFFGLPTVVSRNGYEISLANFTVPAGQNKLARPVAGGVVESGSVKGGKRVQTNATLDTGSGEWFVSAFNMSVL